MLKNTIMIATLISMILGGATWMNSHYASAADLTKLEKNLKKDRVADRISDITTRIFELEFKQRSSPGSFKPIDAALLERFKNELQELQNRQRDLEKE